MVKYLRNVGKDIMMERVNAFKNNEHLPNDILTIVLSSFSKFDRFKQSKMLFQILNSLPTFRG